MSTASWKIYTKECTLQNVQASSSLSMKNRRLLCDSWMIFTGPLKIWNWRPEILLIFAPVKTTRLFTSNVPRCWFKLACVTAREFVDVDCCADSEVINCLWMFDFPANGMNLQIWQIRGFLRCSAEDIRHLSLLVFFTSWFIRLQTLSVLGAAQLSYKILWRAGV